MHRRPPLHIIRKFYLDVFLAIGHGLTPFKLRYWSLDSGSMGNHRLFAQHQVSSIQDPAYDSAFKRRRRILKTKQCVPSRGHLDLLTDVDSTVVLLVFLDISGLFWFEKTALRIISWAERGNERIPGYPVARLHMGVFC